MARLYKAVVPFGRATNYYGKNHNHYEKAWFHAYKDTKKNKPDTRPKTFCFVLVLDLFKPAP